MKSDDLNLLLNCKCFLAVWAKMFDVLLLLMHCVKISYKKFCVYLPPN